MNFNQVKQQLSTVIINYSQVIAGARGMSDIRGPTLQLFQLMTRLIFPKKDVNLLDTTSVVMPQENMDFKTIEVQIRRNIAT